jgi:hypothetical protein
MDELMDLLVTDGSAAQISDQIKDVLFAKSAENIETIRPNVAASIFDGDVNFDSSDEVEFDSDVNVDSESETEEE